MRIVVHRLWIKVWTDPHILDGAWWASANTASHPQPPREDVGFRHTLHPHSRAWCGPGLSSDAAVAGAACPRRSQHLLRRRTHSHHVQPAVAGVVDDRSTPSTSPPSAAEAMTLC